MLSCRFRGRLIGDDAGVLNVSVKGTGKIIIAYGNTHSLPAGFKIVETSLGQVGPVEAVLIEDLFRSSRGR